MIKSLWKQIINLITCPSERAREYRFKENNLRIMLITAILALEQACCGFLISVPGSLFRKAYFVTSLIMLIYFLVSLYFYFNSPRKITCLHIFYEISIGILGLTLASFWVTFANGKLFYLFTIYIAVIYGIAFISYYNYWESFIVYFSGVILLYTLFSIYRPSLPPHQYFGDVVVHNLIAWAASMGNYHKFLKEFNNLKTIEDKNRKLQKKNEKIKEINNKLREISTTDRLTGIPNRRSLEKELERIYEESKRYNKKFSLILCDLDSFKAINDNFGHPAGDRILTEASNLLKNNIRKADICGRWGGEEFLIISPEIGLEEAVSLARRLKNLLNNKDFPVVERVTGSFGVTVYRDGDNIEELLQKVDNALYRAKDKGRNRVET